MSAYNHVGPVRRRLILELEQLEDRRVPATVTALPFASLPLDAAPVLAQVAGTSLSGTLAAGQQGLAGSSVTTLPGSIVNLGGQPQPTLAAAGTSAGSGATPLPVTRATSTQFGIDALPGGPINTVAGGSGMLASGAMLTNGTAGLSPGGIISPTFAQQTANLDALFGVQGLAVRALFPVTSAVGGSEEAATAVLPGYATRGDGGAEQNQAAVLLDGQHQPLEAPSLKAPATEATSPAEIILIREH